MKPNSERDLSPLVELKSPEVLPLRNYPTISPNLSMHILLSTKLGIILFDSTCSNIRDLFRVKLMPLFDEIDPVPKESDYCQQQASD